MSLLAAQILVQPVQKILEEHLIRALTRLFSDSVFVGNPLMLVFAEVCPVDLAKQLVIRGIIKASHDF
jgi:hypothetical protein